MVVDRRRSDGKDDRFGRQVDARKGVANAIHLDRQRGRVGSDADRLQTVARRPAAQQGVVHARDAEQTRQRIAEDALLAHEAVHEVLRREQQAFDVGREGALDAEETGRYSQAEALDVERVRGGGQEIHLPEIHLERDGREPGEVHQGLGEDAERRPGRFQIAQHRRCGREVASIGERVEGGVGEDERRDTRPHGDQECGVRHELEVERAPGGADRFGGPVGDACRFGSDDAHQLLW